MKVSVERECMNIQCDGPEELADALNCWKNMRSNSAEFFKNFQSGGVDVEAKAGKRHLESGGGFEKVTVDVTEYFLPYVQLLKERTGADLSAMRVKPLEGIFHTHVCEKAIWDGTALKATVALMVYPRLSYNPDNPLSTERRLEQAKENAFRYIIRNLGHEEPEKEFISIGRGGLYKRNPEYATGKPPKVLKKVSNRKIWSGVWGHWLENQANASKKEVAKRISTAYKDKAPDLSGTLYLDGYAVTMEWEEFAKL